MSQAKAREPRACENCGTTFTPRRDDAKACGRKCAATLRKRRSRAANPSPQEKMRAEALSLYKARCMHCPKGSPSRESQSLFVISPDQSYSVSTALVLCRIHARDVQRDLAYCRWTIQPRPRSQPDRLNSSDDDLSFGWSVWVPIPEA